MLSVLCTGYQSSEGCRLLAACIFGEIEHQLIAQGSCFALLALSPATLEHAESDRVNSAKLSDEGPDIALEFFRVGDSMALKGIDNVYAVDSGCVSQRDCSVIRGIHQANHNLRLKIVYEP